MKFWMLFVEDSRGFSHKHQTEGDARIEAERLARMPGNRDKKVYVLETILFCKTECPPISWHELGKEE